MATLWPFSSWSSAWGFFYLACEGDVIGLILDGGRSPDQSNGRLCDITGSQLGDPCHDWREREKGRRIECVSQKNHNRLHLDFSREPNTAKVGLPAWHNLITHRFSSLCEFLIKLERKKFTAQWVSKRLTSSFPQPANKKPVLPSGTELSQPFPRHF